MMVEDYSKKQSKEWNEQFNFKNKKTNELYLTEF
jgi:hypothetical protein